MSKPPASRVEPAATEMAVNAAQATAGSVYDDLIKEQLDEERDLKTSLEQRGITVISTSGVLVSLLFGLAALTIGSKRLALPHGAHGWVIAALGSFVVAAAAGIGTNWPRRYREAGVEGLLRLVQRDTWKGPSDPAARRVAELRVQILTSARGVNRWKAHALILALLAEVIGVLCVAVSILDILRSN